MNLTPRRLPPDDAPPATAAAAAIDLGEVEAQTAQNRGTRK